MNKLLLILLFFTFIYLFPNSVFAYDLEASCGTSICALSSHDPIFSPDLQWTPEKSETRAVLINNTDSESKEIFIKARNHSSSTKELDSYININLLNAGNYIWQGTLSDFIDAGNISVTDLSGGDTFDLDIAAEMESGIPNDAQGKSSVFNFGFGFEEESEGGSSENNNNSNSNNSNSSGSESSNNSESAGGLAFLGNNFNNLFGIFGDSEASVGTVAGEETNINKEKDVLGAGENVCRENYLWIVFLIIQVLVGLLLFVPGLKNRIKIILTTHISAFVITAIAIYFLSCLLWPILISAVIFLALVGIILFKKYRLRA